MSGAGPGTGRGAAGGADWERRRRLAEVFGDVLPETTSDEREQEPRGPRDGDTWLEEQVPPHHGS